MGRNWIWDLSGRAKNDSPNLPEIDAGKSGYLYDLNQPREDMDTKVTAAYEAIYGPIPPGRNFLLLDGDIALEDEPVFIPTIKYIFRQ
jgi:hypothetical protein